MVIFARGDFGKRIIQYLYENQYVIDLIIVSDNQQDMLLTYLEDKNIKHIIYDKDTEEKLIVKYSNKTRVNDWLFNIWSPYKLNANLVSLFQNTLNIHPSLVPLHRGSHCATWSIRENTKIGVSIMTMKAELDVGDVYVQKELFPPEYIRGFDLQKLLLEECANIFYENWADIYSGKLLPKEQIGEISYRTRKQTEEDAQKLHTEIMTIEECVRWILAHDFSPNTTAIMEKDGYKYSLRVEVKPIIENKD